MTSTTISPPFIGGNVLIQAFADISENSSNGATDVSCELVVNGVGLTYSALELNAFSSTFAADNGTLSLVAGTTTIGASQTVSLWCSSSHGAPTLSDAAITVVATP